MVKTEHLIVGWSALKNAVWLFLLLLLFSACGVLPKTPDAAIPLAKPTATECGCTLKVSPFPTQKGGLNQAGPSAPGAPVSPGATVTPTLEPTLAAYKDRWQTYTDPTYGFSFEVPAVYSSPEYSMCAARPGTQAAAAAPAVAGAAGAPAAVAIGARTTITVTQTSQDLAAAVSAIRTDPARQAGDTFDQPVQRMVGGAPAVTLAYRSGGTGRYAEITLFVNNGLLYRVDASTPSSCDVPALGLTELSAYAHALDTFSFK